LPVLGNVRATDNQRDVDIGLDAARLARLQPVLSDVVAVVAGVKDVGVVEDAI
jgi:hypothetical protein